MGRHSSTSVAPPPAENPDLQRTNPARKALAIFLTLSALATAVAMALAAEIPVALGCLRLALMHDAPATTTQLAHVNS